MRRTVAGFAVLVAALAGLPSSASAARLPVADDLRTITSRADVRQASVAAAGPQPGTYRAGGSTPAPPRPSRR